MLTLPIYKRGSTYVLHTRVAGKQFKRSLRTGNADEAKLRAVALLQVVLMTKLKLSDVPLSLEGLRRYELELGDDGQVRKLKTDGSGEDHDRLMSAMDALKGLSAVAKRSGQGKGSSAPSKTLRAVYDDFLTFEKTSVEPSTVRDYSSTLDELEAKYGAVTLNEINDDFLTEYMLWLAKPKPPRRAGLKPRKGNSKATVDKKVGTIKSLFNFALSQKMVYGPNPTDGRALRTREERYSGGSEFYELDELERMFNCDAYRKLETTDPDFYWILFLGLITGARVTALARLSIADFKKTMDGTPYLKIWKDKTSAGQREVPIPEEIFERLRAWASGREQVFRFKYSAARGASDDVLDLLKPYLRAVGVTRPKLTFHSFRKTANDYLLKSELSYELRTQYVGHSHNDVNSKVYSKKFNADEMAKKVLPIQRKLLRHLGFPMKTQL
jgi:integrase